MSHWPSRLLLVLGLCFSCASPTVKLDLAELEERGAARAEQVLARPSVDQALDGFLDALIADPAFERSVASLAAVAADPQVLTAVESLLSRMQGLPSMLALIQATMASHPEAGPDELGELVGSEVEATFDLPKVSAVFDELGQTVIGDDKLRVLGNALRPRIHRALAPHEARWSERLIELNGGTPPSSARAADLYLERAWTVARLETFALAILGNPVVRRESARLAGAMLESPAVVAELRKAAVELLGDTELQAQVLDAFSQMMVRPRDEAAIAVAIRKVVMSERVTGATSRLIAVAIAQPDVGRAATAAADAIGADPAVKAAADALLVGW